MYSAKTMYITSYSSFNNNVARYHSTKLILPTGPSITRHHKTEKNRKNVMRMRLKNVLVIHKIANPSLFSIPQLFYD